MISTIGPFLPHDVIAATGLAGAPLSWDLDRPTPRAEAWLESRFPRWALSLVEDWADGRFDALEAVVFSRGDDVVHRLYYYLCELQRRGVVGGPKAIVFDVAAIARPSSEAHTIASVSRLAAELGLDSAGLARGIEATNARRLPNRAGGAEPVCLLPGTPPPQDRLHAAVRAAGFAAFGPTLAETWADLGPVIASDGNPAAAIGRQVHARRTAESPGQEALRTRAGAAVLWYTEEDEARIWQLPPLRAQLAQAGVPALVMTRRDERGDDGASAEIRMFLEGVAS
jgi:hypothetical protein